MHGPSVPSLYVWTGNRRGEIKMLKIAKYSTPFVVLLGIVAIAMGITFIVQGYSKDQYMRKAMRDEQVTLGLTAEQIADGEVIDTAGEAQTAADTIRGHRHNIAPTYTALLNGGRFDPTNPEHLTYGQAMNLENYLYTAVLAFGVVQIALAAGAFMIITGIALGVVALVLFRLSTKATT